MGPTLMRFIDSNGKETKRKNKFRFCYENAF